MFEHRQFVVIATVAVILACGLAAGIATGAVPAAIAIDLLRILLDR